jgi:hypothetical protein
MIEKTIGEEVFTKLRDAGELLALSNNHNGKNCPAGKKLVKCNMNTVVTMVWGPIGKWDTLDNGVLRLASAECYLTLYKTSGLKLDIQFSQGDLRYAVGDWLTMYMRDAPKSQMLK